MFTGADGAGCRSQREPCLTGKHPAGSPGGRRSGRWSLLICQGGDGVGRDDPAVAGALLRVERMEAPTRPGEGRHAVAVTPEDASRVEFAVDLGRGLWGAAERPGRAGRRLGESLRQSWKSPTNPLCLALVALLGHGGGLWAVGFAVSLGCRRSRSFGSKQDPSLPIYPRDLRLYPRCGRSRAENGYRAVLEGLITCAIGGDRAKFDGAHAHRLGTGGPILVGW